jgi:hypothetical protein
VRPAGTRRIPITSGYLTGAALEAAHRGYLEGTDLAAWAEALLAVGIDTDAVIQAVANPEMHWEKVRPLFSSICREVGLSDDVFSEIATLKQEVIIEEYKRGHREATELLWRFDDLRQRIGFPEPIHCRLIEDNEDGTNDSGWYSFSHKWRGEQLEALARQYLGKAGIRASH